MTHITIVGHTTAPSELKFTSQGVAVCTFTVAVNESKKDGDEWIDDGATFYRVSVWRDYAEDVADALGDKGMLVTVTGNIRAREYDRRDGGKGLSLDVTATEVAITIPRQRRQPKQSSRSARR